MSKEQGSAASSNVASIHSKTKWQSDGRNCFGEQCANIFCLFARKSKFEFYGAHINQNFSYVCAGYIAPRPMLNIKCSPKNFCTAKFVFCHIQHKISELYMITLAVRAVEHCAKTRTTKKNWLAVMLAVKALRRIIHNVEKKIYLD